jgi:STE24 endopeptidase
MNVIAIVILITIVSDLVLNGWADYLNLRKIRPALPEAVQDLHDPESYRQSQEYLKVNTRFGWLVSVINLLIILAVWFGKGFPLLDEWVRSFSFGPVVTGLFFMGILILLRSLLNFPFSIYSTFVIEERFGFNNTTLRTFLVDRVKGMVLAIILGIPLISGILGFFEYAGDNAWWYCWIGVSLFMLAMQYIAPTWIMPLFNKYKPLEDGELRDAIFSYAGKIQFSLNNVFVMDGSKRSAKSNAYFTGFGKHKRIVLFDTLIEKHSVPELVGVLAHEMGHFKKKHILKVTALGIVQMGVLFYLLSLFISFDKLFEAFYVDRPSIYAGMIFFGMLYAPLDFFIGFFSQMISRKNEYEADRFAAETTKDPASMIHALKKLSAHNLSNLTPHPFYVLLNYSHPPVLNRIKALEQVQ